MMCKFYLDTDSGGHDHIPHLAAHFQHSKWEIVSQIFCIICIMKRKKNCLPKILFHSFPLYVASKV